MTARKTVKARRRNRRRLVGVITTPAELRMAARMSHPPDLFEVRLDHLIVIENELERKMSILPAPLIITARHPREGGANNLSIKRRRELLLRFLPQADYVDVELRSAKALRSLLGVARKKNIQRIISFHDFKSTPTVRSLCSKARAAKSLGADIFKVATRTDTPPQLTRLLDFIANADVDLALGVMGIGKLGRKSRRELMRRGSVLNYTHLGRSRIEGQPTLAEIRRWALGVGR
jgi:3-dehydroquinate dehydratase-1